MQIRRQSCGFPLSKLYSFVQPDGCKCVCGTTGSNESLWSFTNHVNVYVLRLQQTLQLRFFTHFRCTFSVHYSMHISTWKRRNIYFYFWSISLLCQSTPGPHISITGMELFWISPLIKLIPFFHRCHLFPFQISLLFQHLTHLFIHLHTSVPFQTKTSIIIQRESDYQTDLCKINK